MRSRNTPESQQTQEVIPMSKEKFLRDKPHVNVGTIIDGFYNPVRRHSALDFSSPVKFEQLAVN
jgi:hypothetical protein